MGITIRCYQCTKDLSQVHEVLLNGKYVCKKCYLKNLRVEESLKKMKKFCKDCAEYKTYGFSPLCKYCENDSKCPECGGKMEMGKTLKDAPWICENGHMFKLNGKPVWNPTKR